MSLATDELREVSPGDHPALARSLAEAFFDDPVCNWAARSDAARPRMLEKFFGAYLKHKQKYGLTWADDELLGAAVWSPPGHYKTSLAEDLDISKTMLDRRLFARAPMIGYGMLNMERKHPKKPDHFYLAALGVSPKAQGRGLGSRLLQPVLEICDRDRVPAFLESSKRENVDFYARHGFKVTGEHRMPRGPVVIPMWREPA